MIVYLIGSVALDSDYRSTFALAEHLVRKALPDCDVINPGNRVAGLRDRDYIGMSLQAVEAADAVICTWTAGRARGAAWELGLAKRLGKAVGRVKDDGKLEIFDKGNPGYDTVSAGEAVHSFTEKESK